MAHDYKRAYRLNREEALKLARHYLRHSFNHKYHSDQDAEMECFVDALIMAAVQYALGVIDESVQRLDSVEIGGGHE